VSSIIREDILNYSICKRKDHRGFTLLETLISVTILAFGLLAVVTMLDVSLSASTLSRDTTKATELAGWMIDRIHQDTQLATQPYTASIASLLTYDNDATGEIKLDTDATADPVNEPGRTTLQQWRALLQGAAIANYIGADQLRGDRLPSGRGEVTIVPYDANHGWNHLVTVTVSWGRGKFVQMNTVLATAK
jgi:prepilin-type N-terminal cleavage/methylation domain-containing protein